MPPEVVDFDSGSDFDSDFWVVELEADGASGVPAAEADGSEPELRELEFSEVAVGFALLDEVGALGADTVSPSRA